MSCVIVWFKNDLRLHDNEALTKAIASGKPILPIYCFNPERYRHLKLGFPKTDLVRYDFIKQSVLNLRENLKGIGGNLKIVCGNPVEILSRLIVKYGCGEVFAEQEFATEELKVLEQLKKRLPATCKLNLTWGRTLYHISDIPFTIADVPLTSKTFRKHTQKNAEIRKCFDSPMAIETLILPNSEWSGLPDEPQLHINCDKNYALTYMEGGESSAIERLNFYLFESEQLTSYRWTRNRSLGMEYSSKLSPYMALGCISPRRIYEAVKHYETTVKKNQSTWWLIFEIIWRDYFTFKLMRFQNAVYRTEGYTGKPKDFTNNKELFGRWCEGRTGIPFIDAHMRQLNETGYMSNRGRVNCSSFLVYDYNIDWTWGAAYFESKLIDYDVASNWMNWHSQAYQIWYTNPVHQANKYKAQEFIRKWIPEINMLNDTEILIPWESNVDGYPDPVMIYKKWTRAINRIKSGTV